MANSGFPSRLGEGFKAGQLAVCRTITVVICNKKDVNQYYGVFLGDFDLNP